MIEAFAETIVAVFIERVITIHPGVVQAHDAANAKN
jgi:hypothetical protein